MLRFVSKIIAIFVCTAVAAGTGSVALAAKNTDLVSTDKTQVENTSSRSDSTKLTTSSQVTKSDDVFITNPNTPADHLSIEDNKKTTTSEIVKNNEDAHTLDPKSTATVIGEHSQAKKIESTTPAAAAPASPKHESNPMSSVSPQSTRFIPARNAAANYQSAYSNITQPVVVSTSTALPPASHPTIPADRGHGLVIDDLLHLSLGALVPPTVTAWLSVWSHVSTGQFDWLSLSISLVVFVAFVMAVVLLIWKRSRYRGAPRSDIAASNNAVGYMDLFNIGALLRGELLLFCQRRVE